MEEPIKLEKNVPLQKKTFYGIGGIADEFLEIKDPEAFSQLWKETLEQKIPHLILGKGSNMVLSDTGFRGRVFYPAFEAIKWIAENRVEVEAGCAFQKFIENTNQHGFEDLCPLSGIPGNVGGFVRGNAGAFGMETKDRIVSVKYLDAQGEVQSFTSSELQWEYRGSIFKQNPDLFILSATFELHQVLESSLALQKTKTLLQDRWKKYPAGRSGGCVFKNPDQENGLFAGKILDELGAKGDTLGGLVVAQEHANFFVNKNNATQADLLALMKKWQTRVHEEKGLKLEAEIAILDEWGKVIVF